MPTPTRFVAAFGLAVVSCALGCGVGVVDDGAGGASGSRSAFVSARDVVLVADRTEAPGLVGSGVPIKTSLAKAKPKTVYRVRLDNIDPAERLRVIGEVTISRCNDNDLEPGGNGGGRRGLGNLDSPCEDLRKVASYDSSDRGYDPHVAARLVLSRDPQKDPNGFERTKWRGYQCEKKIHHCPIALSATWGKLGAPLGKPLYVSLQVASYHRSARKHHIAELEADCVNDDYKPCNPVDEPTASTKGHVTVVRLGRKVAAATRETHALVRKTIPISTSGDTADPVVLLRLPVKHVQPGDVIDVRGVVAAKNDRQHNGSYVFDHFLGLSAVLVTDPKRLKPRSIRERWISARKGKNCKPSKPYCKRVAAGAVEVPKSVKPGSTMYVNVIGRAVEKGVRVKNARVEVVGAVRPELRVTCYSQRRPAGSRPCGF